MDARGFAFRRSYNLSFDPPRDLVKTAARKGIPASLPFQFVSGAARKIAQAQGFSIPDLPVSFFGASKASLVIAVPFSNPLE
jgi:hypothetical protein